MQHFDQVTFTELVMTVVLNAEVKSLLDSDVALPTGCSGAELKT